MPRTKIASPGSLGIWLLTLPALALTVGCSRTDPTPSTANSAAVEPAVEPPSGESLRTTSATDPQQSWYAMFIQGVKVGHGHTSTTRVVEHGQSLTRIEEEVNFSVNRNGQKTEETIASTGIETAEGKLLRFQTEIDAGQEPIVTAGEVRDGQMAFRTTTTGKTVVSAIPWPADAGGFKATEHSLARQPMQPGERRTLTGLMVGFNQVADIELTAAAYESTTLLDHSEDLLRIDWTATLPKGNSIRSIWWTNRDGEVLKMKLDALNQVTYRTSREVALADAGPVKFDLLLSTIVGIDRPLNNAAGTKRVRYRVRLATEDPSRVFAAGSSQQVTPVDPHTAEIVVRSIRPGSPTLDFGPDAAAAAPGSGGPTDPGREHPPPTTTASRTTSCKVTTRGSSPWRKRRPATRPIPGKRPSPSSNSFTTTSRARTI